ncbi:hypothetical protein HG15A2_23120 [Adhaeretor mobilis]|uniref:DUF420 domain-containing protein n=2 Tax=Adhaeretor mobilis TaxID=1930276 RepID=A0A517MVW8_9BACT|nr:hypothetical protein HG15A2_23120 [Adhaeretor mobilis]
MDFPGYDGFLGSRASFMLDVVVVAMLFVVAALCWSIYEVRYRKRYTLHKRIQLTLAAILLITVTAFEIDIRLYGWEDRSAGSIGGSATPTVWKALYAHLIFAISSACLWPVVTYRALRRFPDKPAPSTHSRSHVFWARLAAIDMLLTAVTGWVFYLLAFL